MQLSCAQTPSTYLWHKSAAIHLTERPFLFVSRRAVARTIQNNTSNTSHNRDMVAPARVRECGYTRVRVYAWASAQVGRWVGVYVSTYVHMWVCVCARACKNACVCARACALVRLLKAPQKAPPAVPKRLSPNTQRGGLAKPRRKASTSACFPCNLASRCLVASLSFCCAFSSCDPGINQFCQPQ